MRTLTLAAFALLVLTLAPAAPAADGQRTLEGDYAWDGGTTGPLTAVFTPDGDGSWKVTFRFRHANGSYSWDGNARGSLGKGTLSGRVHDSRSRRVFSFEGDFDAQGRFEGTHAEVHGERESATGTLSLHG